MNKKVRGTQGTVGFAIRGRSTGGMPSPSVGQKAARSVTSRKKK